MSRRKWDGKSFAPLVADGYSAAPLPPPPSLAARAIDALFGNACPRLLRDHPTVAVVAFITAGAVGAGLLAQWMVDDRPRRGGGKAKKQGRKGRKPPQIDSLRVQTQQRADGSSAGPSASLGTASSSGAIAASADAAMSSESEVSPVTPKGFTNVGNSCYLNSLLQALASSAPFIAYTQQLYDIAIQIAQQNNNGGGGGTDAITTAHFLGSLLRLVSPAHALSVDASSSSSSSQQQQQHSAPLNPGEFLSLLRREAQGKFAHFNQEDAHELWNVLQDLLERKARGLNQCMLERMRKLSEKDFASGGFRSRDFRLITCWL